MGSYRDLEVYKLAFDLSILVHKATLKLPDFERYEQGSQLRRSSKSIKDQIVEGYGRRRYKSDYIKFLVYAHSSCDEATNQIEALVNLYPEIDEFIPLLKSYETLGKMLNKYINYVQINWRT